MGKNLVGGGSDDSGSSDDGYQTGSG